MNKDTSDPLPFANVYINNSTIGSTTDEQGFFEIKNVPQGSIQIIASYVGYVSFHKDLNVSGEENQSLVIELSPSEKFLREIEIVAKKRDKEWDLQYGKFKRAFLGETANARYCKIVNPEVIHFYETGDGLKAEATVPIEIENKALGYKIVFDLKEFAISDSSFKVLGHSFFEEMEAEKKNEPRRWKKSREQTYERSMQHFFLSVINGNTKKDGYGLYQMLPAASHLAKNVWFNDQELGQRVAPVEPRQLLQREVGNIIELKLPEMIEVHFNRISTSKPVYRDVPFEVSWIVLNKESVALTQNGFPVDPDAISIYGYLASLRIADLMPIDYRP